MDWFKSSYSGSQGGNCVEVAWTKSTHSNPSGNCLEFAYTKSSHCDTNTCVEVARHPQMVLVRDSKNPNGGNLELDADAWCKFIDAVKQGEFDL